MIPVKTNKINDIHYMAYDANGKMISHDDNREIKLIVISNYCEKVATELVKRYYESGKKPFTITMKGNGDKLTIKKETDNTNPFEATYVIEGGIYEKETRFNNLYEVAAAIIHYEEDLIIKEEIRFAYDIATYDDGIFDEYLMSLPLPHTAFDS